MPTSAEAGLVVRGVSCWYGSLVVLRDIDLVVRPGAAVAVLGSNGVGKTTLLRTIAGVLPAKAGVIEVHGRSVVRSSPERIARLGMSLVPEGRALFPNMTVEENLEIGSWAARGRRPEPFLEQTLTRFPVLGDRRRVLAGSLSGGQQQLLAIARALQARPEVLLLDEPSLGLSPGAIVEVFDQLRLMLDEGLAVVIAEQNAPAAMHVAGTAIVLRGGTVRTTVTAEDISERHALKALYI